MQDTVHSYKLTAFFLVTFLLSGFVGFSQRTEIPDADFRAVLLEKYGISADSDNTILNRDAEAVDTLQIAVKDIGNLSGIEAFTSLTSLDCRFNQLTSLDVSSSTALTDLDCSGNSLTSLNVSANTALTILSCSGNSLASLDVSSNTALTDLSCGGNSLASLDVSSNTALTDLNCGSNQLTNLNVSANTALTDLSCSSNSLTSLNVSANTELTRLLCANNQLTRLNVQNGNTSLFLNVSGNPNLTCIQVDDAGNTPGWTKDATAVYSEDCSTLLSSEDFKLSGISISPNPTSGILNIAIVEKTNYRLLNIRGQILEEGVLATGKSNIDISSFAKGIYFLNLKTSKGSFTKKVVKN